MCHIGQRFRFAVGDNDIGFFLEGIKIVHNSGVVELGILQGGFMDDDLNLAKRLGALKSQLRKARQSSLDFLTMTLRDLLLAPPKRIVTSTSGM